MAVGTGRTDKGVDRIMAGTMAALQKQGTYKLSVSDICRAANVSRGTFYRYFNDKDEVLEALAQHFEDGVSAAFDAAIEANPDPAVRTKVVVDAIVAYRAASGDWNRMLTVAPEFTLDFTRNTFPALVGKVTAALGPAAEDAPPVRAGLLTSEQFGELFLRVLLSMLLLPGNRADEMPALATALFGTAEPESPAATRKRIRRAAKTAG